MTPKLTTFCWPLSKGNICWLTVMWPMPKKDYDMLVEYMSLIEKATKE